MNAISLKHMAIIAWFALFSVFGQSQSLQRVNVGKGLNNEKTVLLSEIADQIEYIPLETNNKCLLTGGGHYITMDQDNIVVVDKTFYRFSRSGKFLNTISTRGKGPGEFNEISGFEIDPITHTYFIFDRLGKILNFQMNGELIKSQQFPVGQYAALLGNDRVIILNSIRLAMLSGGYRSVITDRNGTPVTKLLKVDNELLNQSSNLTNQNTRIYNFQDSVTMWDGLCDTVYRITKECNVIPRYVINLGKSRLPKVLSITQASPDYRQEIDKYIMPIKIIETKRLLFLETSNKGKPGNHIYTKSDQNCITLTSESQLVNDLDGGPDFWPLGATPDGKLYMVWDISALKEYWKPNTKGTIKNPDGQKKYMQILDNGDLNDNQIIMLVTLKNR